MIQAKIGTRLQDYIFFRIWLKVLGILYILDKQTIFRHVSQIMKDCQKQSDVGQHTYMQQSFHKLPIGTGWKQC